MKKIKEDEEMRCERLKGNGAAEHRIRSTPLRILFSTCVISLASRHASLQPSKYASSEWERRRGVEWL